MPEVRRELLRGSDEDPANDPVGADDASSGPTFVEGLPPAVPGNGLESSRLLQRWLNTGRLGADRRYINSPKKAWGALRRSPGAIDVARAQGYLAFVCKTHKMIHCQECACPVCGAPGNCTCGARQIDPDHSDAPRLVRPVDGVRRVGYELETMVDSAAAVQRVLNEYPFGYHDGSLRASGWYVGVEFKVSAYGTDRSRSQVADIVDRIHGAGGVGAPHCCGLHVHVERMPDDSEERLRDRWLEVQDDLYNLFPTRVGNVYCEPVRRSSGGMFGHYTVLNKTAKGTWELRIHPGTVSWVVSATWGAWVHGFVTGTGSRVGQSYLDARRAALSVSNGNTAHPWAWRRAIERWHRANGRDHARTLAEIARGGFRRYQSEASLREYLAARNQGNG